MRTGEQDNDYGSELEILNSSEGGSGITKTVNVRVIDEEAPGHSVKYSNDFDQQHGHNGRTK